MKALVNRGPKNFQIEERPDPQPGPRELLLRPAYVGICFSDKHIYDGCTSQPPWAQGLVLGHEISATIEAVGSEVDGWKRGDSVSIDPRYYCGQCLNCRGGAEGLCETSWAMLGVGAGPDGGFADLCVAPAYGCYPLPEGVSLQAAALTEAMCNATRAVRRSGFVAHDNAVVFGAEDYGLFMVGWLRRVGARRIVVVDPHPKRQQAARDLGADLVLDPKNGDVGEAIRRLMPRGADVSFVAYEDYVPESQDYLGQAYDATRVHGTVMMLRVYGPEPFARINPFVPQMKELTIQHCGFFWGNEPLRGGRDRGDWQVSLEAMANGIVSPPPHSMIVDFDDLRSKKDLDDLFENLPHSCSKAMIKVAGG